MGCASWKFRRRSSIANVERAALAPPRSGRPRAAWRGFMRSSAVWRGGVHEPVARELVVVAHLPPRDLRQQIDADIDGQISIPIRRHSAVRLLVKDVLSIIAPSVGGHEVNRQSGETGRKQHVRAMDADDEPALRIDLTMPPLDVVGVLAGPVVGD